MEPWPISERRSNQVSSVCVNDARCAARVTDLATKRSDSAPEARSRLSIDLARNDPINRLSIMLIKIMLVVS